MEKFKEEILIVLLSVVGLTLPITIDAATLYLSPSSGSYNVGQTFQVNVLVSSADKPVNAYSATISFTYLNLEVVSLSQTGSIVNFWAQQPNFLNTTGQILFEGVTFDPGFQGTGGRILTISFRTKAAGSATLRFARSAVLAHDGKGTNILESVSGAQYNIGVATTPLASPYLGQEPEEEIEEPALPEITVLSPDVKITKISLNIIIGDILILGGETEPETTIRIYVQRLGEEPFLKKITSDAEGKFALQYDGALSLGNYLIWAQSEKEEGILGNPTEKYFLKVSLPPFLRFGKITIDYHTAMIALIFLIIVAVIIIACTWYRFSLWRKRLREETKEISKRVTTAFKGLRDEVAKQIEFLDGKSGLNKDEKQVRDKLKDTLNTSEEFINKEIEDVEKELK